MIGVSGNTLSLTHEFLSLMLAVRRAGVTEAIHVLEKQSLIEAHRAEITILNRKGIEKIAGSFYGVPCVDGSGLARTFFTHAGWSVQPCVRPVSAVRMTAGHNALRGSGPDQKPAFEMHWHKWVVLTAGSTGSALRAVRPPNLHITPDVRRDLVRPLTRPGSCTARPWPSWPRPFGRVCWQARSQRLSLACAPTVR